MSTALVFSALLIIDAINGYKSFMYLYSEEVQMFMGASITIMDPHRILVRGKTSLSSRKMESPDLRAGLAFVIAGVVAKGESVIHNVDTTIDRGYEDIVRRLQGIGVMIERVKSS